MALQAHIWKLMVMLVAALALATVGVACGDDDKNVLKVTVFGTHTTLDPPFLLTQSDIMVTQHVYDNLVMVQPDMTLKPMLATSWVPNDDLTSYTFTLREGVKFHHGKVFKAEDVVASFDRLTDPVLDPPSRGILASIQNVVAIGDYTVRFDLDSPSATFPASLSLYQGRIFASDIDPETLALEASGTGPFMISEHKPGERTVMVSNPDYWDEGLPLLDGITLITILESATRAEALKNGDVDLIFDMSITNVGVIEADSSTTVFEAASSSYMAIYMNMTVEPFDNLLVRKALQAATDRETILQSALLGRGGIASDHPIASNDPVFASQYAPPDYNIDLAKTLLEQAGYPNGIDLTLATSDAGAPMVEMAVAFKERAAPAGIRITIAEVPEGDFWSTVWLQEPFSTVWWNGRPPDAALSGIYTSDAPWNESQYFNPVIDQLIADARGQENLEDRQATYAEVQRILIDDVPRIVAVFRPVLSGASIDLRGFQAHPLNWPILHAAWLDR